MEKLSERLGELMDFDLYSNLSRKPDEYLILFEKRFDQSDLNITSRVLNHWKDYGLLPIDKIKEDTKNESLSADSSVLTRKRNKFNFFELIYLYILQDLRKFGFPLSKMKKVKEALLFTPDLLKEIEEISDSDIKNMKRAGFDVSIMRQLYRNKHDIVENAELIPDTIMNAPILSYAILSIIISKTDLKLVILEDGQISFEITNSVGQVFKTFYNSQPHITIPIYNYLYNFLSKKKYKEFYVLYKLLTEQELLLLDQVRNGQYKEIKITMVKGDTIKMELTEELKVDIAARFQEYLLKGEYQELNVKTEYGEITYTTRKTKKKL